MTKVGKIVRVDIPSAYVTARPIDIWLPPGYASTKRYSVLYMQDGGALFDSALSPFKVEWKVDETLGALQKAGTIRDVIVVGIHNAGQFRYPEYWPQKAWESMEPMYQQKIMNQGDGLGKLDLMAGSPPFSDNYVNYIVQEVKPYIDKNYSVMPEPENTFIAGSSMGALAALYAICEHPDIFGGAACLSTHWTGQRISNAPVPASFVNYLKKKLPLAASHRIYFDHGTSGQDKMYVAFQKEVDAVLVSKKYTPAHWVTKTFPGADHNERAWAKRLATPMTFLLKK
jgi:predicted alpha/beta superfamily hydrolase